MRYAMANFRKAIPTIQGVQIVTSLVSYQIFKIQDESWDLFIEACSEATRYEEISEQEATDGIKFYSEARPYRKAYSVDEGLEPDADENGKTKIYFDDATYAMTLEFMKKVAKNMVRDVYDTRESRDGESEVLAQFDACESIREINTKREDLLGIQKPKAQLIDEGLWDEELNSRIGKTDYSLGF